ncbi:RHS repeat-associated core domain-containing protein, partial [Vibrio sp. M260112]|uniref:RHS repeat-associated core domain-containing protein n=1 Tax=Vibrio sp. M260112 TaxID=3020895 RepID=UPI002F415149
TGLYYNLHRYYDTDSGQYLSSDPIGMAGGLRPQAYVHNPMDWVDPFGLAPEDPGKYDVGAYDDIRGTVPGLDAHHVGQKALMKKFVDGYDPATAPAILVPKVGHTIKGPNGIVSRSTKGIDNARQLLARDIKELRRVYSDVPNSQLQKLIKMNKEMYPSSFQK